jgi:glycosyltransferase involved in cell wall biosynthesis
MISWHPGNNTYKDQKFSIIVPTWNNLQFLKICIGSIRKNSAFLHQIIIHVNEGTDGTLEWVRENGFDFTYSKENTGVCWAVNACRALVRTDYIVYMNDDMYMLPSWDSELFNEIQRLQDKFFFLSSTAIEPRISPHPGILAPFDYGNTPGNFRENDLLRDYKTIEGHDWSGATWPPNVVHRDVWDLIGGYSIEYFPGLYSDPDFSMKLYEAGVRYFKGINASRAYHFGSKTTQRIKLNNGSKQFLNKWGITSASFSKYILKRGQPYSVAAEGIEKKALKGSILKSRLKRFLWIFGGTGKIKGKYSFNSKI